MAQRGSSPRWWQQEVIYQVYVRSFQDSNGDGVGDLPGITSRLAYLAWLGVGAVWLTPFYESPMEDAGYDITDHRGVDPIYGTLDDFDALVTEAHALGIRVIVDYVPNHTSRLHPWFREARASRSSARRDWYIWADGRDDRKPPNNWIGGCPGGSAWCWDQDTEQWFLAFFSSSQPELNWANPAVRSAMLETLEFWLARDVDGVRIDMVDFIGKDSLLRDEPPERLNGSARDYLADSEYHLDRSKTVEYLGEIRAAAERHGPRLLIGETVYHQRPDDFARFTQEGRLLDLPTNFRLTYLPLDVQPLLRWIETYDRFAIDARFWPNHCVGNHDTPRPGRHGEGEARLRMLLLLTLRGTPFLYYGDELAMPDVSIPPGRGWDTVFTHPDTGENRDGARTPMAWSATPGHGFTAEDVEPWLPFHPDAAERNVPVEQARSDSMLSFTRDLLHLRRRSSALREGAFQPIEGLPGTCLAYTRRSEAESLAVVLNLGSEEIDLGDALEGHEAVLTTRRNDDASLRLGPHEGAIFSP